MLEFSRHTQIPTPIISNPDGRDAAIAFLQSVNDMAFFDTVNKENIFHDGEQGRGLSVGEVGKRRYGIFGYRTNQ
jgi:hypothetical protein